MPPGVVLLLYGVGGLLLPVLVVPFPLSPFVAGALEFAAELPFVEFVAGALIGGMLRLFDETRFGSIV